MGTSYRYAVLSLDNYAHLAQLLGSKQGSRAVAQAVARSPIWLLLPCNRIIGSDHTLRGYAGGIQRKACLLEIEGHHVKVGHNGIPAVDSMVLLAA